MATLTENIQRIADAKSAIRASIEAKGVAVPVEAHLETYASKIDEIQGGGGGEQIDFASIGYTAETVPDGLDIPGEGFTTLTDDLKNSKDLMGKWDPSSIRGAAFFANNAKNIKYPPVIDTSNCINFENFAQNCSNFVVFPKYNFSKAETFSFAFMGCSKMKSFQNPVLEATKDMSVAFLDCKSLKSINLSLPLATNIHAMLGRCSALERAIIDCPSATDGGEMIFNGCSSLKYFELRNIKCSFSIDGCPLDPEKIGFMFDKVGIALPGATITLGNNSSKVNESVRVALVHKGWTVQ